MPARAPAPGRRTIGAVIFISYRRDDSAGYARALYDALAQRFGAEHVFMDVDDLRGGQAFADAIRHAVGDAKALLVLIGRRWRGEGPDGRSRLDDPADFVHQEVLAGLQRGLRVVPVLLDGTPMPVAAQLPPALQGLAERHAVALGGADWEAGLQRLLAALDDLPRPGRRRRGLWLAAGGAVALLAGVAGWRALQPAPPPPPPPPPARAAVNGEWEAEVVYDWDNARVAERFRFAGEGDTLYGTASFLRAPRGVLEARVDAQGLSFVTRTDESMDGQTRTKTHRYRGRLQGDTLHFVMQTEGGFQSHVPIEFTARRVAP